MLLMCKYGRECKACSSVVNIRRGPHPGAPCRYWGWHRWETTAGHHTGGIHNGACSWVSEAVPFMFLPEGGSRLPTMPFSRRSQNPTFGSSRWMKRMRIAIMRQRSSACGLVEGRSGVRWRVSAQVEGFANGSSLSPPSPLSHSLLVHRSPLPIDRILSPIHLLPSSQTPFCTISRSFWCPVHTASLPQSFLLCFLAPTAVCPHYYCALSHSVEPFDAQFVTSFRVFVGECGGPVSFDILRRIGDCVQSACEDRYSCEIEGLFMWHLRIRGIKLLELVHFSLLSRAVV